MRTRGWRRIGTAIVRWPGPILVVTVAIALIGLLALPGYETSYDARPYMPANAPANVGYAAAERHFSQARLNPELLMIEADHDLRDSGRHAHPGAGGQGDLPHPRYRRGAVHHQAAGNPAGPQLDTVSDQRRKLGQIENLQYQQDRADDLLKQVDRDRQDDRHFAAAICSAAAVRRRYRRADPGVSRRPSPSSMTCAIRSPTSTTSSGRCAITSTGSRTASTFRSASALRSVFDALDGIDALTDQLGRRHNEFGQIECASAETAGADPAPDRHPADQSGPDADELRHHVGDRRSDARQHCKTRPPWDRRSTPPKTTTPSTCPRRPLPTPNSSGA